MDLAEGHLAALRYIQPSSTDSLETSVAKTQDGVLRAPGKGYSKYSVFNLGTGQGYSVLEMLAAMGKACGRELPYEYVPRREGI